MSKQRDKADHEIVDDGNNQSLRGVDQSLTPLQYHYLSLLQRLIATKNSYQTDPNFEAWKMAAIKKSIYSALMDCIEANVGDTAKEMVKQEHQVN